MNQPQTQSVLRLAIPPAFLLLTILVSVTVGQMAVPLADLWTSVKQVFNSTELTDADIVLWHVRAPRILTGALVGAALAMAGATYQGMFKNPLVSPDILGVTAGAGLGAVLAIYASLPLPMVQLMAFAGGLLTVSIVYCVSQLARHHDPILALVLSGIAVAALFGAGIALIKVISDPYTQLTSMTFWMMGSLTMATFDDIISAGPLMLISIIPLVLLRWRMNLLSLNDEEAEALGINVKGTRIIFILSATLMTSAAVSITGVIGWIGLVIPHIARLLVGPDFRKLLPTSLFIGAGFLVLADTIARTCFSIEVPLGVITAFVGAPFFLGLLIKGGAKR